LKRHLPVEDSKLSFKKSGTSIDVTIPEELFRADGLQVIKHFIQVDIFKFTSLKQVNFVETYENKQAAKPQEQKPKEDTTKVKPK
jgi:peptidylprolyl isomerase